MNNLYKKIYEAIDTGIHKALVLPDEIADDVSVKFQHKKLSNNVDLIENQLYCLLSSHDRRNLTLDEPKKVYKEILRRYKNENYMYIAKDYADLKTLITYIVKNMTAKPDLNWIDVTNITDMSYLFSPAADEYQRTYNSMKKHWSDEEYAILQKFNGDISKWDVRNVYNMSATFALCTAFNCDISGWDVSNVKKFICTFAYALNFNQPIGSWNTEEARTMYGMFQYCRDFDQPLNGWDVSHVSTMECMFKSCKKFNQPLNNWDVMGCSNMQNMFDHCRMFRQNLHSWLLLKCKNKDMFKGIDMPYEYMPRISKIFN